MPGNLFVPRLTNVDIEFDNYGACMSVSEELLCAFELLKVCGARLNL